MVKAVKTVPTRLALTCLRTKAIPSSTRPSQETQMAPSRTPAYVAAEENLAHSQGATTPCQMKRFGADASATSAGR